MQVSAQDIEILYEFDGPQIIKFKVEQKKLFLGIAVFDEEYVYPFLCFEIKEKDYERFKAKYIDLKSLFYRPLNNKWYILDFKKSHVFNLLFKYNVVWNIPKDFFPENGIYIEDPNFDYAFTNHSIYIDNTWQISDFTELNQLITDIFSFAYFSDNLNHPDPGTFTRQRFEKYPWIEGFSTINFYKGLSEALPISQRPKVNKLQFASPGEIEISANSKILNDMDRLFRNIVAAGTEADRVYSESRKTLKKNKLLDVSVLQETVDKKNDELFSKILSDLDRGLNYNLSEGINLLTSNKLATIKIIFSVYKRLFKFRQLVFEEKVKLNK